MENFNKIYLEENIFYIENFISDPDIEEVLANVGSWTLRRQDHHEKISFSIFESEDSINKFKKLVFA